MNRRRFLAFAAAGALARPAQPARSAAKGARVVVIGGGYGGATAAKYLKLWEPVIDVTLVEPGEAFVSCPLSNLVVGGHASIADISRRYDGLASRGVRIVRDAASAIDARRRSVRLRGGAELTYDRLVVSPGVEFILAEMAGYEAASASGRVLAAWKAGPETLALRRQVEEMPDGGVFVLSIPLAPYRCPPGPYERACQVASYFRKAKPRSKVLVFDANPDITSKAPLFRRAWEELYRGMIDYQPNSLAVGVDAGSRTLKLELDEAKGDVLNVIPPQRAAAIAGATGLITHNQRWCNVDWRTMESTAVPGVHVLGDATLAAPAMAKAGHMANQHGKLCAAAIIDLLSDRAPNPDPVLASACYSFVSESEAIHVASVHRWNDREKTVTIAPGSNGISAARSEREATYAWSWARNIWDDMLT
ncbi:MAG: FAD-dependent oxidoreductase [Betaproteobacteria bacterium]|nr:FAD-dependent oxidoreductase [Betaproteobacteria bacterium]